MAFLAFPARLSFGVWDLRPDGLRLVSTAAPWRDLILALDEIGREESDAPVSVLDEAEAIVACGWRYGSYAYLLCGGESLPMVNRGEYSWMTNSEMKRVNLEFSAAVAAWLADRAQDPSRIARRVRAAQKKLPQPWALA